ncbi:unnamed protein product, partial [Protopolystoma xenopodis]
MTHESSARSHRGCRTVNRGLLRTVQQTKVQGYPASVSGELRSKPTCNYPGAPYRICPSFVPETMVSNITQRHFHPAFTTTFCPTLFCLVLPCPFLSLPALICHALPRPTLPSPALLSSALYCLVLSCSDQLSSALLCSAQISSALL